MHTRTKRRPSFSRIPIDALERRMLFAFGATLSGTTYTVDTGANTVFTVSATNGDLMTVTYHGTQMLAPYSLTGRYSHYESGLSSTSTTVTTTTNAANGTVLVSCADSSLGVTQYYMARRGFDNVYMASYAAALPTPGEMRFITYMNRSVFTHPPDPSNISQSNATVEGSDVFYNTTTGYTYSKFYGATQTIDDSYHGLTGTGVGAWMDMGDSWQTGSGGPFFKDIEYQTTADATELYDYMYSGHNQTESFRPGLHGPYALQFTNGLAPVKPDYSFVAGLGLTGYVSSAGRGSVAGVAGAVDAGLRETVALSNATGQFWATPDASGNYTVANVIPGTYTETLYQGELAVGTETVAVTSGATTPANIVDTYCEPAPIWRIGTWDGTPAGFLNFNNITVMHPSDTRMSPWTPVDFVVGTTPESDWPLAEWVGVNNANRITFTLTAPQAAQADTLRIGISWAFAGGRPQITVNAGTSTAWTSAIPSPSAQPDSRGITKGSWRGNNTTFAYNIPTGKLVAGTNTVDLPVVSGSSGTTYLSPAVVFDAIDLVPTTSLTNAPVVSKITVTPASPGLIAGATQAFVATAYDPFGKVMPANVAWSTTAGTIAAGTGFYTAPATPGSAMVTATTGTVSGSTTATIVPTTFVASAGDGFYVRLAPGTNIEQVWVGTPGSVGPAFSATPTYAVALDRLPSLTFGPGLSANGALTVDASNGNPIPAGGISYDGGPGTDTLSVIGTAGADAVTVNGTQVRLGGSTITYANTEAIRLTLGAGADVVTQAAQPAAVLTWTDPTAADALAVTAGTFTFPAPAVGTGLTPILLNALTVGAGAKLVLGTAAARTDRTVLVLSTGPTIAGATGAWTGTIDVGGNDLLVKGGNLTTLTNQLRSGTNAAGGGYWNGPGIDSATAAADTTYVTALGSRQNDGSVTTFDGQPTAAGDVLIKYTEYGDANLDGVVDVADYTRLDAGFIAGGKLTGWFNGDFNYDGAVDGSDYTLTDNAFNMQAKPAVAATVMPVAVVAMPAPAAVARPALVAVAAAAQSNTPLDDEKKRRKRVSG